MNSVIAVIVTYNRLEMLKACIERLCCQDDPCDILIVDNASTDGTGLWAETLCKDATGNSSCCRLFYENTGANLGGAGGFAYGIKKAFGMGYDFIWIMDDDVLVHKDSLSELMEADRLLGSGNYGYLGSIVLWTDGTECKMNRHILSKRYYEDADKLQYSMLPVQSSTFVSLLLPRETVRSAGLPIKEYFIWGDDVEYTMRITLKLGMKSFAVGKSIVTHAMKQNNGSNIAVDDPNRFGNYKHAFRNENHTYRMYGARGFFKYILRCGRSGLNVLLHAKDHRIQRLWIIVSRFFTGFFFNPKTEYPE